MSLEGYKSLFEIGGVVLLFLTFVFGAGALITSNRINVVQSQELRDFKLRIEDEQQKTALAQKEAAEAQLALRQYVNVLAKSANPRLIDHERFIELMKGNTEGSAEIWYEPDDEEAHFFAIQLMNALGPPGLGWHVNIQAFATRRRNEEEDKPQGLNLLRRQADLDGMAIGAKDVSPNPNSLGFALQNAIRLSVGGWGISGLEVSFGDPTMQDKSFIIAVGPHHVNVPIMEIQPARK
ncbi:MAG: hypothetical protein WCA89_05000 [Terracidiphilus sp.]|jgi:hypothetical protein